MLAGIRSRLTYANVMASIAVFVALGLGTAWALEANSVKSKHIVNGQVREADVGDGAVTASKLADGSVGTSKLGTVPAASLSEPTYNVDDQVSDNPCFGSDGPLINAYQDYLEFNQVDFDTDNLVSHPNASNPDCSDGFRIQKAGTYLVTASIRWAPNATGTRRIQVVASEPPDESCCDALQVSSENAANSVASSDTRQTTTGIAQLKVGARVGVLGLQTSSASLGLAGGNLHISWLGP